MLLLVPIFAFGQGRCTTLTIPPKSEERQAMTKKLPLVQEEIAE